MGYDFAVVHGVELTRAKDTTLGIHAAFAPTLGIRAGQPVTFKARAFGTTDGEERWDFGEGAPKATTRSDGNVKPLDPNGYAATTHAFVKPGAYSVTVTRSNVRGVDAMTRLWVRVE